MSHTKFVAVVFLLASAVVQANQCSRDGECPSDGEPQNGVLLLQTKLQANVNEDVKKLARVEVEDPDAMDMMQKASSHGRHLATIRPPQPMKLSKVKVTLNFQSAVPTFGPGGNYIALIHKYDDWAAPVTQHRDDHLWHALQDYDLFCSGPNKSHQVRMRIFGGESDAKYKTQLIWHCDWPKEEAHAGGFQVFLEEADGTKLGHLDTSYDPTLLQQYNNVACVTSVWGTKGVLQLPQWFEYNLIHGVDHFLVYTMTGTDERVMDIYNHYLNDGVATRIHLEIPDRLSEEYKAEGYSTQVWLANDCLYRMKNHAKWMSPTIDVDEYVRVNQSTLGQDGPEVSEEINYGASPWDGIRSNWEDNANNPSVHSLSFGRYTFARSHAPSAVQISSSKREGRLTDRCPKYVVNPALVNALWVHWATSWVAGSVPLRLPHQLAVANHYQYAPMGSTVNDLALVAEVPAVIEAIEARFGSTWESLVADWGAMQLMEFTMHGREREEEKLSMGNSWCSYDYNKIDQIEISTYDKS